MGMGDILAFLMENVDERYRKQIHYILQRLNSDHVDEETHSDTEEDNDYDDMEEEDEMGEVSQTTHSTANSSRMMIWKTKSTILRLLQGRIF